MEEEEHRLYRPLLSLATTHSGSKIILSTPTTLCIAQRLLLVAFIGVISVWANHEASKGFEIRVINEMEGTRVGDRFSLFFVSNDEATRLVQTATTCATKILYTGSADNAPPDNIIDQIDVRLAGQQYVTRDNLVAVTKISEQRNAYLISVSPTIMEYDDFKYRFRKAIQRGMAEVFLSDKRGLAPATLVNGLVEYISNQDGSSPAFRSGNFSGNWWEDKDPKVVALFLGDCEGRNEGFIGRLYQAIGRYDWNVSADVQWIKAPGMTAS